MTRRTFASDDLHAGRQAQCLGNVGRAAATNIVRLNYIRRRRRL